MAKKKRVGFYIEYSFENNLYVITCEFESNGNINISINHNAAMDPKKIENVIRLAINEPILEKIKTFWNKVDIHTCYLTHSMMIISNLTTLRLFH